MKNKNIFSSVLKYFFCWRILLFGVAFLAAFLITDFGNRFPYVERVLTVTNLPNWIWGFGNFDGVHYLRIAQNGYTAEFTQAFFPLYPLLIRFFNFLPKGNLDFSIYTDPSYFYTGMILSTVFFVLALYFLFKLWVKEYNKEVADLAIIFLLSFPTAFYFGSVYSESLFLLLAVLVFWFNKKGKIFLSGIFAGLASATKIQGILLFVFLAMEMGNKYFKKGEKILITKDFLLDLLGIVISPLGLIFYMFFLQKTVGDPLFFLTSQPAFGAERSSLPLVLLPQVIFRYIKIFGSVDFLSLTFFNAFLELFITMILVLVLIFAFKKIKLSYWFFVAFSVLLPTLTGTLSSMPRYALLSFPFFPIFAKSFGKASKKIIIVQIFLQALLLSLFIRGYWVS